MSDKIVTGIAGSGAMGSGIAQVAAVAGHQVILFDTESSALDKAKKSIRSSFDKLVEKGKLDSDTATIRFEQIKFTTSISDFSSCGILIEAIVENLGIKKELFQNAEKFVSADCILATNTSSLPVVAIAAACK